MVGPKPAQTYFYPRALLIEAAKSGELMDFDGI